MKKYVVFDESFREKIYIEKLNDFESKSALKFMKNLYFFFDFCQNFRFYEKFVFFPDRLALPH